MGKSSGASFLSKLKGGLTRSGRAHKVPSRLRENDTSQGGGGVGGGDPRRGGGGGRAARGGGGGGDVGTTINKEVDLKPVIVKLEVLLVGHVHERASTKSPVQLLLS